MPESGVLTSAPAPRSEATRGPQSGPPRHCVNNSSPPPHEAQQSRAEKGVEVGSFGQFGTRAKARGLFHSVELKGASTCGLKTRSGVATLKRGGQNGAVMSGVSACGSPWVCPVCGPRIAAVRANALAPQFNKKIKAGWTVWLLTLTLRHGQDDGLRALFDLLAKAWGRLTSGKAFQKMRDRFGGLEYVRGYDLTHGRNGWHPHLHIVVAFGPAAGSGEDAARDILNRWRDRLASLGREALERALDMQPARSPAAAAAYAMTMAGVSKHIDRQAPGLSPDKKRAAARVGFSTIAEATAAAAKRGRAEGGETAADLRDRAITGDRQAYALFAEYAKATKGRQAVVVSQGLRLKEEKDAAQEDDLVDPEVVANLRDKGLFAIDPHLPALLEATTESATAAHKLLIQHLGPPGAGGLWCLPMEDDETFGPLSAESIQYLADLRVQRKAERERKKARKERRKAAPTSAG